MHWVTLAGLEHVHEVRHQRGTSVFVCVLLLMVVVMFTAHRSILLTLRSLTQLSLDATSHAHMHSSKQASRRAIVASVGRCTAWEQWVLQVSAEGLVWQWMRRCQNNTQTQCTSTRVEVVVLCVD